MHRGNGYSRAKSLTIIKYPNIDHLVEGNDIVIVIKNANAFIYNDYHC